MCGIVGYVGKSRAAEILIDGLQRLEYRGYDSAGLALLHAGALRVSKTTGKVAALRDRVQRDWPEALRAASSCGIAHTRWATHGAPNEANAHPHLDSAGSIAVVHNGIIENYRTLRAALEARGHVFRSETDSEVLAHLIADAANDDLADSVRQALAQVRGTFGLAVISSRAPDTIIAARRGSAIAIGAGEGAAIVASDAAALLALTRHVRYLDDHEIAVLQADSISIRDGQNRRVERSPTEITLDASAVEKGGFAHYMLKEIHEQPAALRNAIRGRIDHEAASAVLGGLNASPRDLAAIRRIVIVGCGTSRHAGMVGEYAFEALANLQTEVEQAAEFRYRNPIIGSSDLVLAISQSGETADTLAAVREAHRKGALVMGLCNVVGSALARETGRGVILHAGPEISVASTKAFTCQVAVLLLLALQLARSRNLARSEAESLANAIAAVPELVAQVVAQSDAIGRVAENYFTADHAFFIGRGPLFPVALEGALKLKEISYVHAEGYHAAELKHGPIALLTHNMPVIALLNDIPDQDKTLSNVEECKARGARIIGLITAGDTTAAACAHDAISVPRTHPLVTPILTTVALQLFAYHMARLRGCEIDQPRNLAKSVTVE